MRSEVRHNLFLAVKETLNNTVKHSGATEVRVTLEFVPGGFRLLVADNGRGFDPSASASSRTRTGPRPATACAIFTPGWPRSMAAAKFTAPRGKGRAWSFSCRCRIPTGGAKGRV